MVSHSDSNWLLTCLQSKGQIEKRLSKRVRFQSWVGNPKKIDANRPFLYYNEVNYRQLHITQDNCKRVHKDTKSKEKNKHSIYNSLLKETIQFVYRRVKLSAKLCSHFPSCCGFILIPFTSLFSQYSSKYVYSMSSFFDLRRLSKALSRRLLLLGYCSTSLPFSLSAGSRIDADFRGSEGYYGIWIQKKFKVQFRDHGIQQKFSILKSKPSL